METKPFHFSVVDAIVNCTGPGEHARQILGVIGDLILVTKIPENHESIAREFKKAADYWGDGHMGRILPSVLNKLQQEEQK